MGRDTAEQRQEQIRILKENAKSNTTQTTGAARSGTADTAASRVAQLNKLKSGYAQNEYAAGLRRANREALAGNWYQTLRDIVGYAEDKEDNYDQTMNYLDRAKKDLEQIKEEATGTYHTQEEREWYDSMVTSYDNVIGYLTDRGNQENTRAYTRNTEALQTAKEDAVKLGVQLDQLRFKRNDFKDGTGDAYRMDRKISALQEQADQQQDVVRQLQEEVDNWKPNTNERREELIRLVQGPLNNIEGNSRREKLENRAALVNELNELDDQLYNNQRSYTFRDRSSDILSGIVESLGSAEANAAGTGLRALAADATYRRENPDVGFLGTREGTGAGEAEQQRIEAARNEGWSEEVVTARGELKTLQDRYSQMEQERKQYRDGSADAIRLGRKMDTLQEQIRQKEEKVAALEEANPREQGDMDRWGEQLQGVADQLGESANRDLQRAKEGVGAFGQFGIDATVNLVQMGFDVAVGAATGGGSLTSMFVRTFGDAAREARLEGADLNEQLAYGITKGSIEVATEKIFDGLAGAYGEGFADRWTEKLVEKLADSTTGRNFLRAVSGSAQEGAEEVLSDFFGSFADLLYKDESWGEALEENMDTALYDFILGATMGSLGGITGSINGEYAEKNAALDYKEELRQTGIDVDAAEKAGQKIARGKQGKITEEEKNAWEQVREHTQQRQLSLEEEQRKEQLQLIRDARKATGLEGTTATKDDVKVGIKMGTGEEETTKEVSFAGFTTNEDGKTEVVLETPQGQTFTADPEKVDFGDNETGAFLEKLSTEENPDEMWKQYTPGQDAGEFIQGWNLVSKLYGRLSGINLSTLLEEKIKGSSLLSALSNDQIAAAFKLGRAVQEEKTASAALPEGVEVKNMKPGEGNISYAGATVDGQVMGRVVKSQLSQEQKGQVEAVAWFARVTGMNVVFYQSQANEAGAYQGANGAYKNGVIYLDVNAGRNAESDDMTKTAIVRAAAHEMTHFIKDFSPADYEIMRNYLVDNILMEESVQEILQENLDGIAPKDAKPEDLLDILVAQKQTRERGRNLSYEEAMDEVVADACEMMLKNSKVAERLAAEQPKLAQRIQNFLKEWVQKIRDAFRHVDAQHAEAKAMMQQAETMQAIWDEALENASRRYAQQWRNATGQSSQTGEIRNSARDTDQKWKQWNGVEDEAARHFGTTDDYRVAGYLLRDGRKLDFSGAHWLEGYDEKYVADWRKKNDIRQVDHEDVYEAFEQMGDNPPNDSARVFIERGNIRLSPEAPGIELSADTEPTAEQYAEIREMIRRTGKDRFFVDLMVNGRNRSEKMNYSGAINPERIVADLKHYYQTGEIRQQSDVSKFRYSNRETKDQGDNVQVSKGPSAKTGDQRTAAYILANSISQIDNMNPVTELSGTEMNDRSKDLPTQIEEFFESVGGKVHREGMGDVILGEYGVGGIMNHKPINRAKMVTLHSVPDVIRYGRIINYDPNWKGKGYPSLMFAAPVTIAGRTVYVAAVVDQRGGYKFYLNECVDSDGNYVRIKEDPADNTKSGITVRDGVTRGSTGSSDNTIPQSGTESKTRNSAREDQITFDDLTGGEMATTERRASMTRTMRTKEETAERLTEDVKAFFRNVDEDSDAWLSEDEIDEAMDFNLYGDSYRGYMSGADLILQKLSGIAENQSGSGRTETYELMERVVEQLSAENRNRWTQSVEEHPALGKGFADWYNERHPSLYYPGYRPGDLFDKGKADSWTAWDNQKREEEYLRDLIASGRLTENDRAEAEDFLRRLEKGNETFYSVREYEPDERDLVREYAARPTTKDETLQKWLKKNQKVDALRLKLRDLNQSLANMERQNRQNAEAGRQIYYSDELIEKTRKTRDATEEEIRRAEKAIASLERTQNYKRAAALMRSEWSSDPRETARLIRELREANRQLEAYAEYWKKQGSITGTGEEKAKRSDVKRFTGELVEHAGYQGDRAQLESMMQELADTIVSNNRGYGLNWEDIQDRAQRIANELVNNSYTELDPERSTREALRDRLREMRIRPDEMWTNDIGDWNQFRGKQMGTLFFSRDGESIDDIYQQLNGEFGDGLFPPDVTAGSDQIYQILATLENLRATQHFNFADREQAAMAAAYYQSRIVETMLYGDIGEELTIADRNFQRLQERLRKAERDAKEGRKTADELRRMQRYEIRAALESQRERMNRREDTLKLRRKIDKTGKRMIKYLTENNGQKNPIPEPLKEAVGKVLLDLDLSGGMVEKQKKRYVRDMQEVAKIVLDQQQYMNGQSDKWAGMYLDLPADTLAELNDHLANVQRAMQDAEDAGRTWNPNMMNLEELGRLDEILTVLTSAITNSNEILSSARGTKISQMASKGIDYLKGLGKEKNRKGNADTFHRFLRFQNTTPYYYFKKFGEPGLEMFQLLQEGWDKFAFNARQVVDFAEKTYTAEEAKQIQETIFKFNLRRMDDLSAGFDKPETVTMTKAQVMSLYCLWKREQARGHLAGAGIRIADYKDGNRTVTQAENYLLDLDDIGKITGVLTARDRQIADALQKYMNTVGSDWGNEVSMKRFGIRSFTEQNYFPIQTDDRSRQLRNPASDTANLYRLLNMSFTKNTVREASNSVVIDNVFDVFANHMADMAKYNGLGLPMLDAMKWFSYNQTSELNEAGQYGYESIQKQAEIAFGREARTYFTTFMQDLNGVREGGRGEDFASRVMSNYKVAAVAANLRVALLQPTSYVRAGAVLDPKYLAKGLQMSNKQGREEAARWSGTAVWKDLGFYDTNINAGLREMIKHTDGLKEKIQETSMKGAEIGDKVTWGALWNACKAEQSTKGLSGDTLMDATAKRFREVVYRTQVMDSTMTRSHMMRAKGAFAGMVTAFMSEPTLTWNMLLDAYGEYEGNLRRGMNRSEAWQKSGRFVARTAVAHVSTALMAAIVESAIDGMRDDDRYAEYWERFANAMLGMNGNLMQDLLIHNKLPVIKDIFAIAGGSSVDRMDLAGIQSTVKAFNIWKETIALGLELQDQPTSVTYKGNMTPWGRIYQLLQAASRMSGLPIGNTLRDAVAIWNTTVGEFAPSMKIQTYNPGKENEIRYALKDGYLTEDEAVNWLLKGEIAKDEIEARQKVFVWQNGKKFNRLIAAMNNGNDEEFAAAVGELEELRYKPSSIETAVKNEVRDRYVGRDGEARISKEQAVEMLMGYGGMYERNARELVEQWTSEIVTGIKYDDIDEAYVSGDISKDKAQAMLIQYGGLDPERAADKVQQWSSEAETGIKYSEIDELYFYGDLTADEAERMYIKYGGKDAEEAHDAVLKVKFKKDFGYDMERINIQQDYADGGYTHNQMKQILMEYRYSKTETSAESTVTRWDFVGDDWSLDSISGYEAQRYYEYNMQYAGVNKHEWLDWLEKAKAKDKAGELSGTPNGKGGYISYSKVDKILTFIDTFNLSPDQKDALFLAGWDSGSEGNEKNLSRAPWRN